MLPENIVTEDCFSKRFSIYTHIAYNSVSSFGLSIGFIVRKSGFMVNEPKIDIYPGDAAPLRREWILTQLPLRRDHRGIHIMTVPLATDRKVNGLNRKQ